MSRLLLFVLVLFLVALRIPSAMGSGGPDGNSFLWSCVFFWLYRPVCGTDGKTHYNRCFEGLLGEKTDCKGRCPCEESSIQAEATGIDDSGFTCDPDGYLNDCARDGPIDEQGCLNRDCCWHDFGQGSPDPSCFFKNSGYQFCANQLYRSDCGELSTPQSECESNGCCWNRNDPYPACFFPNSNIDQANCQIPIPDRQPCGDGTNQQTCEGSGCCWWPLDEGSDQPWCYTPGNPPPSAAAYANATAVV